VLINYTLNIQIKEHSPKLNVVTPYGVINKPFSVGDNIFIMENQEEIWKDVVGYEGHYQVSNLGNVRSLKRNNSKLLKARLNHNNYCIVRLYKDNDWRQFRVHRLMAMAFISNPLNKPQVNHINGVKTDNRLENLEWCTNSENQIHAYANGLNVMTEKRIKENNIRLAKYNELNKAHNCVQIINKDTKEIYLSIKEASIKTGIKAGTIRDRVVFFKHIGNLAIYKEYLEEQENNATKTK